MDTGTKNANKCFVFSNVCLETLIEENQKKK